MAQASSPWAFALLLLLAVCCSIAEGASSAPVTPRCRPTFGYNAVTKKCVPCASPFCWQCQADYRKCTQCVERFYSFVSGEYHFYLTPQGQCKRCVTKGCSDTGTCNPDGSCRTCDEGLGKVGKQCLKCRVPNCVTCDGNLAKCTNCYGINGGDYYLTPSGQCKMCNADTCNVYVDGSACRPDGTCKECDRDYVRRGTKCVPKPKCVSKGCISCLADPKTCTECDGGYYLTAQKTCLPCKGSCGRCNPRNPAQCTDCFLGYGLVNVTKTCVKCPANKNCADCNGTGRTCSSCFIGQALDGKGGCKGCDDSACYLCDASAAKCTQCLSRTNSYVGSTLYIDYWQLDPIGKKCVRVFREKNTTPPDEYY
ncbi:hypothetical protein ABPG77_005368 [Micractinium sp. CCAP 211/92]